jgi:hypothetical protein
VNAHQHASPAEVSKMAHLSSFFPQSLQCMLDGPRYKTHTLFLMKGFYFLVRESDHEINSEPMSSVSPKVCVEKMKTSVKSRNMRKVSQVVTCILSVLVS